MGLAGRVGGGDDAVGFETELWCRGVVVVVVVGGFLVVASEEFAGDEDDGCEELNLRCDPLQARCLDAVAHRRLTAIERW